MASECWCFSCYNFYLQKESLRTRRRLLRLKLYNQASLVTNMVNEKTFTTFLIHKKYTENNIFVKLTFIPLILRNVVFF